MVLIAKQSKRYFMSDVAPNELKTWSVVMYGIMSKNNQIKAWMTMVNDLTFI